MNRRDFQDLQDISVTLATEHLPRCSHSHKILPWARLRAGPRASSAYYFRWNCKGHCRGIISWILIAAFRDKKPSYFLYNQCKPGLNLPKQPLYIGRRTHDFSICSMRSFSRICLGQPYGHVTYRISQYFSWCPFLLSANICMPHPWRQKTRRLRHSNFACSSMRSAGRCL